MANNQNYKNKNEQHKKRSGAKRSKSWYPTQGENKGVEMHMTYGWMMSKEGLISVRCTTTSKTVFGDKGWGGSVACTLTNPKTGASYFHWGTMELKTGKVVVDKLALVLNPKAPNGGYCGTYNR